MPNASLAQSGLKKVNHIIIVMQENHSFDNYFGALPYAPGTPYHRPSGNDGCDPDDHRCIDGLSCLPDATGALHCFNSNLDDNGSQVFAFHETSRCVIPGLNHSWFPTHQEVNYVNPRNTLGQSLMNGFVPVNDSTEQIDNGVENPTEDQTIGFFTQTDIPFYYDLWQKNRHARPPLRFAARPHVSQSLVLTRRHILWPSHHRRYFSAARQHRL